MSIASESLKSIKQCPLVTVDSASTVGEALDLARSHQVHHLPVMEKGVLVGLVCTCDLHDSALTASVRQAMTAPPITLEESQSALAAARRLKSERVGSIVVVDENGAPSGIVTRGDLIQVDAGARELLHDDRCVCCGLTRHLSLDARGQMLCIYCRDGATDGSWLDLTEEGS